MGQKHDFTNILWGEEFAIDSSLDRTQGVITGQGQMAAGDTILITVRCHVEDVDHYPNTSDIWQARVSFENPVSLEEERSDASGLQIIKQRLQAFGDAIQQIDLYRRVEDLLASDELTKVANRGRFESRLESEWRRLGRERQPISLIMFALDGFPAKNERSDPFADEYLQEIAQILGNCAKRPSDLVARYQPYMFAVLLPNTAAEGADRLAQEMKSRIANAKALTQKMPAIALRMGVTTIVPDQKTEPHNLVETVERSLA